MSSANSPRLSLAALLATKPGHQPRLIYRTHRGRRGGMSRRKGFTEADYAALLDAAHRQLSGPIVLVWDNPCSNSVQLVPLHPIIMSILFHLYKELNECSSKLMRYRG